MKQVMLMTTTGILAVITALIIVFIVEDPSPTPVTTQQAQPQRERYQAPEWVVNERGQRCIKQGDIVTCG
jgi:hypothetical protein